MASDLSEILARVDVLKAQIDALRPIKPEQEARLMQKLRLEWNYHSNALEGNKLTLGETRAFLLQGLTAQGKPFRDYLDIKGYNEAILLLEEFVRQERPLTEADIRELHKIILVEPYHVDAVTFDGTPTRRLTEPGKYKTTPNHVLTSTGETHYYASPEETPAKMGDLMEWYRRELEKGEIQPLLLAATFHYEFAAIHPFDDGNGRMARLLMNLILMQTGFVPVVVQLEAKEEYLLALEKADTGDLEDFIVLIGRGLLRSMELYVRAARGESIEELGDLDKRIALLQRRVEGELGATQEWSLEAVAQINNNLIEPFLILLHKYLRKLDVFFTYDSLFLYYSIPNREHEPFHIDNIDGQLARIRHAIRQGHIVRAITFKKEFNHLVTNSKFSTSIQIDFFLLDHWVSIIRTLANTHSELSKVGYRRIFTEDEIGQLVYRAIDDLSKTIEEQTHSPADTSN